MLTEKQQERLYRTLRTLIAEWEDTTVDYHDEAEELEVADPESAEFLKARAGGLDSCIKTLKKTLRKAWIEYHWP